MGEKSMQSRQPAIFVGHGDPMMALRDDDAAIDYQHLPHADYAVPTPDHFLPLLTVLDAAEGEQAEVFNKGRNLGSISMTSYAFGLGK